MIKGVDEEFAVTLPSTLESLSEDIARLHACVDGVRAEAKARGALAEIAYDEISKNVSQIAEMIQTLVGGFQHMTDELMNMRTEIKVVGDAAMVARSEAIHAADRAEAIERRHHELTFKKLSERPSRPDLSKTQPSPSDSYNNALESDAPSPQLTDRIVTPRDVIPPESGEDE
jgi:methyl-accepting chemotaxis protein